MGANQVTTDVVVVGAGAAGLVAATACRLAGLKVLVVEASSVVGGSTAPDTGHVWLPGHPFGGRGAKADDPGEVLAYVDGVVGAPTAASSSARREAFVATAPVLGAWLSRQRVTLYPVRNRPDLHPGVPGWRQNGRVITSGPWDRRMLGDWAGLLGEPAARLEIAPRSARGVVAAARALAQRALSGGDQLVHGGPGVVAQLLLAARRSGIDLWLDAPLTGLLAGDTRVEGVRVLRAGVPVEVRASRAVVLACGGFEASDELRGEHLPLPTDTAWSSGWASNTGVGMAAAAALGAPLVEMDDAWWTLISLFGGVAYRMTAERSLPHGLVVDAAGQRFVDEAGPMPEIGRHLYERNRRVRAVPAWLVVDNRHRQRYPLGPWLPGSAPGRDEDTLVRAESLAELATMIGVDRAGLIGTVVRFNQLAAKGDDPDFGRGASPVDRANGDATLKPNPNLGTVEKAPYWAVPLFPGDVGTKGGVVVDADARVLGDDGQPLLTGLFATSGTAASLFPRTGPGHGAALGSALVDAFRAAAAIVGPGWEDRNQAG